MRYVPMEQRSETGETINNVPLTDKDGAARVISLSPFLFFLPFSSSPSFSYPRFFPQILQSIERRYETVQHHSLSVNSSTFSFLSPPSFSVLFYFLLYWANFFFNFFIFYIYFFEGLVPHLPRLYLERNSGLWSFVSWLWSCSLEVIPHCILFVTYLYPKLCVFPFILLFLFFTF